MNDMIDRIIELVGKSVDSSPRISDNISKAMHGENIHACFGALATVQATVLESMLEKTGDNPVMQMVVESAVAAALKQLVDVCDKYGISVENELKLVRSHVVSDTP